MRAKDILTTMLICLLLALALWMGYEIGRGEKLNEDYQAHLLRRAARGEWSFSD